MKIISLPEFEALLALNNWNHEQHHEVIEYLNRQIEKWDDENESCDLVDIHHVFGCASKTSTLNGITIIYTEGFNYVEYDPDSLSVGTEGQDDVWSIEGIAVYEDGCALDAHELTDYLPPEFSNIDYSVLQIARINNIDVDEDSDMETFTLEVDNAPDIRFTGERIASTASSDNREMGSYSGQTGRWTELALYRTKGGKFICHQIGRTRWSGERDRFSGKVCETLDEVKEFFGHRWLAKELYTEAGIDDTVEIE